jgi:hypothetical protein
VSLGRAVTSKSNDVWVVERIRSVRRNSDRDKSRAVGSVREPHIAVRCSTDLVLTRLRAALGVDLLRSVDVAVGSVYIACQSNGPSTDIVDRLSILRGHASSRENEISVVLIDMEIVRGSILHREGFDAVAARS